MNSRLTIRERAYLAVIKNLPCGVCDARPPSDAHHIEQGKHYLAIPLCRDCHMNQKLGWHGEKRAWKIRKLTELDVLNNTIEKLM